MVSRWWADGPVTRNFDGVQMVSGEKMLANGTVSVSVFAPSHLQDRGWAPLRSGAKRQDRSLPLFGDRSGAGPPPALSLQKIKQKHWYQ